MATSTASSEKGTPLDPLLPTLVGWFAVYGLIYWDLDSSLWVEPQHSHAPFIILVVGFLCWRMRQTLVQSATNSSVTAGSLLLVFGIFLVLAGTAIQSPFFQMLSQLPMLAGILLLVFGRPGLQRAWFPLLYLMFMVPIPGIIIDTSTALLKEWISHATEMILYGLGYPIARSGVVLSVGHYDLLVADACSGLNSVIALSALVTLMVHLRQNPSKLHNGLMLLSILPIALAANLLRVLVLVLLTYHAGSRTGEAVHDSAGIFIFTVSLLLFFGLDNLLSKMTNAGTARGVGHG